MAVYESPGAGRVLIALSAGPLVAEPTWTRFDELADCRCFGFDVSRGRQSELDLTEAGTARVYFHDRSQTLNDDDLLGRQILLQLYDPVAAAWEPCYRGLIDDVSADVSADAPELADIQLDCQGVFSYLARVKMLPGVFGDVLPDGMAGVVFYEDGPVDERIESLLADAKIDASMYVVFSGNVDVNETLYDTDDVIAQAMRDAADAEFPGVANVYEDRFGRVCFHGRFARFDPEGVIADGPVSPDAWDFHSWQAATREDVTAGVAQIREFSYNRPTDRIVNAYVAWPRADENGVQLDQAVIETLVRTDTDSIDNRFGYCGRSAPDLIIKEHKTNGNTGVDECGLFGDYYVGNYASPRKNVQRITFKSIRPGDARAEATWALMTQCDISDRITLTIDEAGIAAEAYFVEGIQLSCRPANPDFDIVEFTPNLSPAAYYTDNVFED